jgi:ADP-heptose:LPS heptosyltransferase
VKSCAVIHTGGLGDFVQVLPALEAIRAKWPAALITIVGRRERATLAVAGGLADRVIDFNSSGLDRLFVPGAEAQAAPPWLTDVELLLNFLPQETFNANLARLTAARVVHATSFPAPGTCDGPVAQFVYDQLAPQLNLPPRAAIPRLRLRDDCAGRAAAAARFPRAREALALHPGSGSARKNWPLERFLELSSLLAAQGQETIWLLGPAELERSEFAALARERLCLAAAPLVEMAALVSLVRCYVGNDSGVTHLAAALGVPTVALFGPSAAGVWAPRGPNVCVLTAPGGDLGAMEAASVQQAVGRLLAAT